MYAAQIKEALLYVQSGRMLQRNRIERKDYYFSLYNQLTVTFQPTLCHGGVSYCSFMGGIALGGYRFVVLGYKD